ncbi:MAG TPA: DUF6152 family protein [Gammaproteobacteria bacterium]|nr:DUF6152 family protein [Gammaproteobacteria bacterium]
MALATSFAHHAPVMYDTSREEIVTGTVAAFEWIEPHTRVDVIVTGDDGTEVVWSLEGMTPSYLGRRGWSRDTLEPGDRIEVVFFARKDGTNGGMFIRATLPDGSLKVMADVRR